MKDILFFADYCQVMSQDLIEKLYFHLEYPVCFIFALKKIGEFFEEQSQQLSGR